MAFISSKASKVVTVLRNNWKKSVFFSGAGLWLSSVWIERSRINSLMRQYCEEANKIGEEFLKPTSQPPHVTVILNPAARKRKSKKDYENYVEPILHCAGFKVSLIQTESQGQERDLMSLMSNTDSVIIAGGTGSIHDAITGMLRRSDGLEFAIGVIPLGVRNIAAKLIHGDANLSDGYHSKSYRDVKQIADSTLAVVKNLTKDIDILRIESLERSKVVYSISGLTFGALRDITAKCEEYWYLGNRAKPYLAMVSKTLFRPWSNFTLTSDLQFRYSTPCDGCSNCMSRSKREKVTSDTSPPPTSQSRRWWSAFTPKAKKPVEDKTDLPQSPPKVDYSSITNENCGTTDGRVDNKQNILNVTLHNDPHTRHSDLILHESDHLKKGQFVLDAVAMRKGDLQFSDSQVTRVPVQDLSILFESNESKADRLLEIDGEQYELENIYVKRLPERVSVFTLNNK